MYFVSTNFNVIIKLILLVQQMVSLLTNQKRFENKVYSIILLSTIISILDNKLWELTIILTKLRDFTN